MVLMLLGTAVAIVVVSRDREQAKVTARARNPASRVTIDGIQAVMYGPPTGPTSEPVDTIGRSTLHFGQYQKGGWYHDEDGWSERFEVFSVPAGYTSAKDFVLRNAKLAAFEMFGTINYWMGNATPVPGLRYGQEFTVNVENADEPTLRRDGRLSKARLDIDPMPDGRHVVVTRIDWQEGKEPPEGEIDRLRSSLRSAT